MDHEEKVARRKALLGMRIIGCVKMLSGCLLLLLALEVRHILDPVARDALRNFLQASWLDAESHFFHDAVKNAFAIPEARLHELGVGLLFVSSLHLLEGIGLICGQTWAEWLVVVNTGIFVPWEISEIIQKPNGLHITTLMVNLAIMAYFVMRLVKQHRRHKMAKAAMMKSATPA